MPVPDTSNLSQNVQDQIEQIIVELNSLFAAQNFDVDDQGLFQDLLIDQLGKDDKFNEIYKTSFSNLDDYKQFGIKLDNMRSTFLPIELIKSTREGLQQVTSAVNDFISDNLGPDETETIIDSKFFIESYENAFFRILGMPIETDISNFTYQDAATGEYLKSSESDVFTDQEILEGILTERQNYGLRRYKLDKKIFSVKSSEELLAEQEAQAQQTQGVVPTGEAPDPSENAANENLSLDDLKDIVASFHKTTYLLFPPVQDSKINKCISEPEKFISRPFMSTLFRKYNNEAPKITMLESIIRVRLDKLSGYDENQVSQLSGLNKTQQYKFQDVKDSYSFIESLAVNRLYSALYFLSENLSENIEDYIENSDYVKLSVNRNLNSDDAGRDTGDEASPVVPSSNADITETGKSQSENAEIYRIIKSIDDTISLILTSSETINIQSNTFRTSAVSKGEFMDVISNFISVPGKFAESKIKDIEESKNRNIGGTGGLDDNVSKISITLGVGRGLGLLDFISFSLAMFLIEERYLIGLLNEEEFKQLKKSYPTFNFFRGFQKPSINESLQKYTEIVIGVYELAKDIILNDNVNLSS